jgi:hypothetical protein
MFGSFSPLPSTSSLSPLPPPSPLTPCFQAETVLPLSLILLRESINSNKKDKAFLLVEIRIGIQGDS